MTKLQEFKKEVIQTIENSQDLEQLKKVHQDYLGKKGKILFFLVDLKKSSAEQKREKGRQLNDLKNKLEEEFKKKEETLRKEASLQQRKEKKLDVTRPASLPNSSHLHLLTLVQNQIENIFQSLGFSIVEGPEVEDEYHNFDALNIPADHPARDQWDTLWLKEKGKLLRTHTSPVQVRYMEKHYPPFRIIAPGRCFRHEATDSNHEIQFNQIEGLMVGKEVTIANFKALIEQFSSAFFGPKVKTRMRPSYFPFTEPSFEIDFRLSGKKWTEVLGAGMVHPAVLKEVGYSPEEWQGFAFGMGIDRLAMLKYQVSDIRLFYQSDLRFIEQF
jgi:phenylalanyl-tRNA synthetase alpha chain